jgi:Ser/Thr protein kinase RdoA (MazF antagonist)
MNEPKESFYHLEPHQVMNAVEEAGFLPTGEFQQLNSYENRVFDIQLEKADWAEQPSPPGRLIAKFYRPGRWSRQALLDEHQFLLDLKAEGIPAIAPYAIKKAQTLLEFDGMYVAFFPKFYGRMPQEFLAGELKQVGHTLARIHNIGAQKNASHRPRMNPSEYGWQDLETVTPLVDGSVWSRYQEAAETILEFLEDRLQPDRFIRIHGDCHKGNLLHNGKEFFFVDFDDFLNGPVAQDFWMLFSGGEFFTEERDEILEGYEELREFPDEQFELFEPLRGLRILHYAAWIARRWRDPSFPRLFPDFGSYHYWAEETEALEKIAWSLD